MFLTREKLLDIPILYLSRYITAHKVDYYRLLQSVRDDGDWEPWLLYMLDAVAKTAGHTLALINEVRVLMQDYKFRIRAEHPRLYSQDLLNNLFRHPYTRIEFVQNELNVTRQTAARYLDELTTAGFLMKHTAGRSNYYVNTRLVAAFSGVYPRETGDVTAGT